MRSNAQAGFSLIDVIVAIALFAILMAAISGMVSTAFRSTGQSDARTQKTVEIQEVAEALRRQWLDPTPVTGGGTLGSFRRQRACYGSGFSIPDGFTVTVNDVVTNQDGSYTVGANYALSADCSSAAARPAFTVRRVRIQSNTASGQAAELTMEMY